MKIIHLATAQHFRTHSVKHVLTVTYEMKKNEQYRAISRITTLNLPAVQIHFGGFLWTSACTSLPILNVIIIIKIIVQQYYRLVFHQLVLHS